MLLIANINKKLYFNIIYLLTIIICMANYAIAQDINENTLIEKQNNLLLEELLNGYEFRMSILSYVDINEPSDSTQNPDNDFLKLNKYSENLIFRPDISLSFKNIYLSAKPRYELRYEQFSTGSQKGKHDQEHDIFINEYRIQYQANEKWFLSYGRQFLQWGPSFLCSPSNPFFFDNGKSRPNQEGEGIEFAKLLWIPNSDWTNSLIVNTDNGRDHGSDFEKIYAIKTDYAGGNGYASLILSYREGDNHKERIGIFGGLTATDALLLYGEADFQKGSDALYPVADNSPLNYSMKTYEKHDTSIYSMLLVGGTYTFESGSSLTCEYLYNQMGYNDKQAKNYHQLRQNAHDAYNHPNPVAGLARQTLGQTIGNGLMFLRRNYLMLQYIENDVFNLLNLSVRWTHCIDDNSDQFVSLVEFYVGDNTRFFGSGIFNHGGHETAFGSILDYQAMIGIEYIF